MMTALMRSLDVKGVDDPAARMDRRNVEEEEKHSIDA
jgi:hypothetical protein